MPIVLYVIFSIIAASFFAGVIIYCVYGSAQKKYDAFIMQNSVCLKRLNEINARYNFYPHVSYDQSHTYDNEKFYSNISCEDYLIYQLQYIKGKVFNQIEKVGINKKLYDKYSAEVNSVNDFGQFLSPIGKLKLDTLLKRERQLIEKNIYGAPVQQFCLTVTLYCSKINGQIYSRKSENFFAEDIYVLSARLNDKTGGFYNDRGIWDAICRVERGKVSNKMRFSIYERDGYRCRKCGVSDRWAQLEIDHVIPIAKGGKTVYNNLQTLCRRCNKKKGDSLY